MGVVAVDEIQATPLARINVDGGDVLHAYKCDEDDPIRLGEAYFSMIYPGKVKAWKMHKRMTLNLVVPSGRVQFAFFDQNNNFASYVIGDNNYCRLTVPPGLWFGFKGLHDKQSLILNLADIPHDPSEVERRDVMWFEFEWEV